MIVSRKRMSGLNPILGLAGIVVAFSLMAVGPSMAADTKPVSDASGKPQARLVLGEAAPEIQATTLDGKSITLAALHGDDSAHPKLIVLQFGSLTEPIFRAHSPAVERLADRYAGKVAFIILYQQEAHAADSDNSLSLNTDEGFGIAQPLTIAERQKLARQAVERLKIKNQTLLVDAWNNTSSLRYGSYPNMSFIIDDKGNLQAGYPWMDTAKVASALDMLIAGKPLSPELKGSVKLSASAPLDFTSAAMDMTGGRGPATIAMALEHIDLTEQQRQTIFPALAEYLASLQAFRQSRGNAGGGAGGAGGAAPPGAARPAARGRGMPMPGADDPNAPKPATAADVQGSLETLRTSAAKLKSLIKQTLPEKDATQLLTALEQTQAQRLFANPR